MADYKVTINIPRGQKPDALKNRLSNLLSKEKIEIVYVQPIKKPTSRAERLAVAAELAEEAKGIVEELKSEMEEWRDSIPENLQSGDKYSSVSDCTDALEEIEATLDGIDWGPEFPGMFA